jgi:transcriptional regulator with XRE-family HTH domain
MNDSETLQALGRLIADARKDRYPSRRQFAITTGVDIKTVTTAEKGERELAVNTQRRIEQALGWRKGSIEDVWLHRSEIPAESLTVQEMERGSGEETWEDLDAAANQVRRASQLTDEELLAELSYRFRNYKVQIFGES